MSNYMHPYIVDEVFVREGCITLMADDYYTHITDLVSVAHIGMSVASFRDVVFATYCDEEGRRHDIDGPSSKIVPLMREIWVKAGSRA